MHFLLSGSRLDTVENAILHSPSPYFPSELFEFDSERLSRLDGVGTDSSKFVVNILGVAGSPVDGKVVGKATGNVTGGDDPPVESECCPFARVYN